MQYLQASIDLQGTFVVVNSLQWNVVRHVDNMFGYGRKLVSVIHQNHLETSFEASIKRPHLWGSCEMQRFCNKPEISQHKTFWYFKEKFTELMMNTKFSHSDISFKKIPLPMSSDQNFPFPFEQTQIVNTIAQFFRDEFMRHRSVIEAQKLIILR
ncbi:hypothetical protein Trydic_g6000 [Trypoxylus dichotomus]